MRPLPPGPPPHIATAVINLQQSLKQQEGMRQLDLSQQNGAAGQPNLGQPALGSGSDGGMNRLVGVIGALRLAFVVVRLVVVAAVLWIMWHIFMPY